MNTRCVRLKIDFVSDVSCPWCVIGLRGLEHALQRLGWEEDADIHLQPFELNPQMPPEGQDIAGKNFYRPTDPAILAQFKSTLPPIELFPITAIAESWSDAKEKFFADGKIFDQIYKPK